MGVYLVFIHLPNERMQYGGYFSTKEKAEAVCKGYNQRERDDGSFAEYINVTDEVDDDYLI